MGPDRDRGGEHVSGPLVVDPRIARLARLPDRSSAPRASPALVGMGWRRLRCRRGRRQGPHRTLGCGHEGVVGRLCGRGLRRVADRWSGRAHRWRLLGSGGRGAGGEPQGCPRSPRSGCSGHRLRRARTGDALRMGWERPGHLRLLRPDRGGRAFGRTHGAEDGPGAARRVETRTTPRTAWRPGLLRRRPL